MVEVGHNILRGLFPIVKSSTSSSSSVSSSAFSSSFASSSASSSSTAVSSSSASSSSSTSFTHLRKPIQGVPTLPPVSETPNVETPTFPVYAIVIIVVLGLAMTSAVLYFLCRCIARRKRRRNQLATMTPKAADPRMAGIRADHPIQFVVPTTVVVSETTEDSLSDTDYSSSGSRFLPVLTDARLKRAASGFHINPEDLEKGMYEGITSGPEPGTFLGDLGKIGFSLHYNYLRNQLCVRIIGASHLPCLFLKTTANPCVKVALLPDKCPKYITKAQKNTVHPVFNETFVFPVRKEDLDSKKIKISVWDYDRFSRKLLIGLVVYAIKDGGLTSALSGDVTTGDIWMDLRKEYDTKLGRSAGSIELLFSLSYNPESSFLTLSILKARGLLVGDKEKETAVYAKVTLYVRRKLVRTKKSSSKRKLPDTEFNNTFHIHVPQGALSEVDLLVTLCEKSGISGKRTIGRTQVGSNCNSIQGLQHWQDMINSPKSTSAQWHLLSG